MYEENTETIFKKLHQKSLKTDLPKNVYLTAMQKKKITWGCRTSFNSNPTTIMRWFKLIITIAAMQSQEQQSVFVLRVSYWEYYLVRKWKKLKIREEKGRKRKTQSDWEVKRCSKLVLARISCWNEPVLPLYSKQHLTDEKNIRSSRENFLFLKDKRKRINNDLFI